MNKHLAVAYALPWEEGGGGSGGNEEEEGVAQYHPFHLNYPLKSHSGTSLRIHKWVFYLNSSSILFIMDDYLNAKI